MEELILGDNCFVTDYVANGSFKSLRENVQFEENNGYAIFVRLTDFSNGWNGQYRYVTQKSYNFLNKSSLQAGDLVIANVGTLGKSFIVPDLGKPMTLAPNSILVRPKNNKISAKFLKHYFDSQLGKELIQSISSGTTQQKFNKTNFRELKVFLPSITDQHRILSELNNTFNEIEKLSKLKRLQILESEKLLKSIINFCYKEKFKTMKIGDLGQVSSGGTPSSKNPDYWGGDIEWYSSGELNQKYTEKSIKKITNEGLKNSNAKVFPKGSLLVGMYDTAAMKMSILREESTFNQAIVGIAPNKIVSTEYLLFTLTYLKNSILQQRRGVRQQNLSLSKIKNIEFPIPTPEIQESIVKKLDFVSKQNIFYKGYLSEIIENLLSLKSSVLTKALKFEI